jgi:hypothetical protein
MSKYSSLISNLHVPLVSDLKKLLVYIAEKVHFV